MEITTVAIERLRNLGNYENVKVRLESTVGPGETAEQVYAHLHSIVEDLLFPELRVPKSAQPSWPDDMR